MVLYFRRMEIAYLIGPSSLSDNKPVIVIYI